VAVIRLLQKQS